MGDPVAAKVTLAEYLEREELATEKHEYHAGYILAMSGGTANHSALAVEAGFAINTALRSAQKSCTVYSSDLKVYLVDEHYSVYPDLTVVCGPKEFYDEKQLLLTNPTLVVEVLSPSTSAWDLGPKLKLYKSIPALREVLFIWSERIFVQRSFRETIGWGSETYDAPASTIPLPSLGIELTIESLYGTLIHELPWLHDSKRKGA